jgi:hypothetical protein
MKIEKTHDGIDPKAVKRHQEVFENIKKSKIAQEYHYNKKATGDTLLKVGDKVLVYRKLVNLII